MDSVEQWVAANTTRQILSRLDDLQKTGEQVISEIAATTERLFPEHFTAKPAGARLRFTFYGIEFLARVELPLTDGDSGMIVTYMVTDDGPPKLNKLDVDLCFDWLGNVNQRTTKTEAARQYLPALINELRAKQISLKPQ